MANAHAAPELERLPWLTDDLPLAKSSERWLMAGLGATATALVAAGSFWFGMNSPGLPDWRGLTGASRPEATVQLTEPEIGVPVIEDAQPAPMPTPMPQIEPVPAPPPVALPPASEVKPVEARPFREIASTRRPESRRAPAKRAGPPKRATAVAKKAAPAARKLQFTNPWESAGVSGRMVRIGTYANTEQAKQAWSRLVRVFPGIKRLPAVVTDIPSLRNGRAYYRLQIGTTSQAHSEVLCQRMKAIGQSCVTVDLSTAQAGALAQRKTTVQKRLVAQKQTEPQKKGQGSREDERQPVGL